MLRRSTRPNPTPSALPTHSRSGAKTGSDNGHTNGNDESKSKRRRKRGSFSDFVWLIGGFVMTCVVVLILVFSDKPTGGDGPYRRSLFTISTKPDPSTRCQEADPLLSRGRLDKSLALGAKFMVQHQKEAGNFDYEYDWTTNTQVDDDMEVRQAGALWGLALIFHDMMDTCSDDSIPHENLKILASRYWKGIQFYQRNSRVLERVDGKKGDGLITHMRFIVYPESDECSTGTQALVCLSIIEILRGLGSTDPSVAGMAPGQVRDLQILLSELMPFLVTQHSSVPENSRFWAWDSLVQSAIDVKKTGMWYGQGGSDSIVEWWLEHANHWRGYFHDGFTIEGDRTGGPSPYYDGETLLAITKAAKYMGSNYAHLWPVASGSAEELHRIHVELPLRVDEDSDDTKGFYQWSSMCFFELATVAFGEGNSARFDLPRALQHTYPAKAYGLWLIDLAMWMIDVHETLEKRKNTGYAYEGIVHAWAYASWIAHNNADLQQKARHFHCTIEEGMDKLTGWQVGMGAEEDVGDDWDGERGLGGVQNSESERGLRIDTTQHQMHAVILTRRYVYPVEIGAPWPWEDVTILASVTKQHAQQKPRTM